MDISALLLITRLSLPRGMFSIGSIANCASQQALNQTSRTSMQSVALETVLELAMSKTIVAACDKLRK